MRDVSGEELPSGRGQLDQYQIFLYCTRLIVYKYDHSKHVNVIYIYYFSMYNNDHLYTDQTIYSYFI